MYCCSDHLYTNQVVWQNKNNFLLIINLISPYSASLSRVVKLEIFQSSLHIQVKAIFFFL